MELTKWTMTVCIHIIYFIFVLYSSVLLLLLQMPYITIKTMLHRATVVKCWWCNRWHIITQQWFTWTAIYMYSLLHNSTVRTTCLTESLLNVKIRCSEHYIIGILLCIVYSLDVCLILMVTKYISTLYASMYTLTLFVNLIIYLNLYTLARRGKGTGINWDAATAACAKKNT